MKEKILLLLTIMFASNIHALNYEKLIATNMMNDSSFQNEKYDPFYENCDGAGTIYPNDFHVNETNNEIIINNAALNRTFKLVNSSLMETENQKFGFYKSFYSLGDYQVPINEQIKIYKNGIHIKTIKSKNGISFILKSKNDYVFFGVDSNGIPVAVDTNDKEFNNHEIMEFLKKYDSDKFEESRRRAAELGLKKQFDEANVLIWGQTYYSTVNLLEKFWKPGNYLYLNLGNPIQYDLNGNGYQLIHNEWRSRIVCVGANGEHIFDTDDFLKDSDIDVKNDSGTRINWFVAFSGNIYYLFSNTEMTEVYRIRNTWDSTNLYALANNGYTEDEYGKYVNEVLPKLSKAELRLLRNTVFALYGLHFKSEDLAKHFDKQVWYTDEGKASGEIELPAHRQKLVEMIQALEK